MPEPDQIGIFNNIDVRKVPGPAMQFEGFVV